MANRLSAAELAETCRDREVYEIAGQESRRIHVLTKKGDQTVEYLDVYLDENGVPEAHRSVTSRLQWDLDEEKGLIRRRA